MEKGQIGMIAAGILVVYGSGLISYKAVDQLNQGYVQQNPVTAADLIESKNEPSEEIPYSYDVDQFISMSIEGEKTGELPVETERDFIIFEGQLYVTNNQGETWAAVPDNEKAGYAKISEYTDSLSNSQFYITANKVAIVYGGRGPENISIVTTDMESQYWSAGSISKTATHDLEKGYDELYIGFVDEGQTGYLAAVRKKGTAEEEVLIFWSVNSGVTWDEVFQEELHSDIALHFGLEGEDL